MIRLSNRSSHLRVFLEKQCSRKIYENLENYRARFLSKSVDKKPALKTIRHKHFPQILTKFDLLFLPEVVLL